MRYCDDVLPVDIQMVPGALEEPLSNVERFDAEVDVLECVVEGICVVLCGARDKFFEHRHALRNGTKGLGSARRNEGVSGLREVSEILSLRMERSGDEESVVEHSCDITSMSDGVVEVNVGFCVCEWNQWKEHRQIEGAFFHANEDVWVPIEVKEYTCHGSRQLFTFPLIRRHWADTATTPASEGENMWMDTTAFIGAINDTTGDAVDQRSPHPRETMCIILALC